MNGSGKQVLNKILENLSTKLVQSTELSEATGLLRTGLLYRGSTSGDKVEKASLIKWGSDTDDGQVWRQGVSTLSNIFVADIFEEIWDLPEVKSKVIKKFPMLKEQEYEAAMFAIWAILTSQQMYDEYLPVECNPVNIDIERCKKFMEMIYSEHFEGEKEIDEI